MGITAIHRPKDRKDDDGQRVFDLLIKASGKECWRNVPNVKLGSRASDVRIAINKIGSNSVAPSFK
jgi:hypothetical protein